MQSGKLYRCRVEQLRAREFLGFPSGDRSPAMIPLDITNADCRFPIGRCSAQDFLSVLATRS
jgi:hypothetical protein